MAEPTKLKHKNRDAWLETRKTGIGASDICQITGVTPWGGPMRVFLEKMGMADVEESDAMYWGTKHEPTVAAEFAQRTGFKLEPNGLSIWQHGDHPWALATPDFFVKGSSVPVEIKTTRMAKGWGLAEDEVPEFVRAQVTWQMGILGEPMCHVAVLIAGSDYRQYIVEFDKELWDFLLEEGLRFWKAHLDPEGEQSLPPADADETTTKYLSARYATVERESHVASDEVELAAYALAQTRADEKEIKTARTATENYLKQEMADAGALVARDGTVLVTWNETKGRTKIDWKAAYEEMTAFLTYNHDDDALLRQVATILEVHTTEGPGGRRFLLKATPKDEGDDAS